eukprot:Amastigsp_a342902_46.p4 type:complete len:116 gc:universal Amastigsp_a342902_46:253-600(+)
MVSPHGEARGALCGSNRLINRAYLPSSVALRLLGFPSVQAAAKGAVEQHQRSALDSTHRSRGQPCAPPHLHHVDAAGGAALLEPIFEREEKRLPRRLLYAPVHRRGAVHVALGAL